MSKKVIVEFCLRFMIYLKINVLLIILLLWVGCQIPKKGSKIDSSIDIVSLTEYSDFQCPFCAQYYLVFEELKKKLGDKVEIKFRYFPLTVIHQNALISARAAQAAKEQGKFYPMHNLLFKNQKTWSNSNNPKKYFIKYASKIGLNMDKFRSDFSSIQTKNIILKQKKEGIQKGVNKTPTFLINGMEVFVPPKNYKEFKLLLEQFK